jgi:hypothetical protein
MESIPGIWHELPRNRWRVKLCKDGEIYHRSYHCDFESAYMAWFLAKQEAAQPASVLLARQTSTPIAKFLRQPPPEGWRSRIKLRIKTRSFIA